MKQRRTTQQIDRRVNPVEVGGKDGEKKKKKKNKTPENFFKIRRT